MHELTPEKAAVELERRLRDAVRRDQTHGYTDVFYPVSRLFRRLYPNVEDAEKAFIDYFMRSMLPKEIIEMCKKIVKEEQRVRGASP